MKTMLIPVDFTKTSENAIEYAMEWYRNFDYGRIILLRVFSSSIFDNLVTGPENHESLAKRKEEDMERLREISKKLNVGLGNDILVSLASSELPLLRSIIDILNNNPVELIVLGSDHFGSSNNSFISSNVIAVAKISPVRVLIVPSFSRFGEIQRILVPIDFNALESVNRLESYHTQSPKWKEKELLVLNVDPKEKYLLKDPAFDEAEQNLHAYLKNFKHSVYYSGNKSIINGMLEFLGEHKVELIVALPGKHSFLYNLTHKSISEALYRKTPMPILILK
jgi:nucleotide-binding universal stress UspA family protein